MWDASVGKADEEGYDFSALELKPDHENRYAYQAHKSHYDISQDLFVIIDSISQVRFGLCTSILEPIQQVQWDL